MSVLKSIATVGGYTMLSRLLGFARDILVASSLGAGMIADAFFIAFKFPNVFRRLFAEGAFNAAFVPIFAGKLEAEGHDPARDFAVRAFSMLFWVVLGLVTFMQLVMPWAMQAFAPGFMDNPDQFDLAVTLTRITFPYLLMISLVSLLAGVLNSLNHFAAAAATPVILNLCLIGAVLILAPLSPTPAHALAWGVFAAGVLQFLWLLFHCIRLKMPMALRRPRFDADIRHMGAKIIPGAIGAGIYQINMVVDMVLASLLPTGAISYLFYADRVTQLPLGVVGVAVGTALLPVLSRHLRKGQTVEALESQNRAIEFSLLLTLPAAGAFLVLHEPIIRVLFERGAFSLDDSLATAGALMIYAVGLPFYVLNKALTPSFFARGDTKTPMKIAALCMGVNVVMNLILMQFYAHLGLAMATVISAGINTLLLASVLIRRGHYRPDRRLIDKSIRIILSVGLMVAVLHGALTLAHPYFTEALSHRIMVLSTLIALGLMSYALAILATRACTVGELKQFLRIP